MSSNFARISTRFSLPLCVLLGASRIAASPATAPADWQQVTPSNLGPSQRRQEGLGIVDQPGDRLVVVGGENGDGYTWALNLTGTPSWTTLPAPAPGASSDVVRAIYDSVDRRMILVTASLDVLALDLANPTGWVVLASSGSGPPPRRYPAIAYDSLRNRLLLFGGGPDTGIYNDVWALSLTAPAAWVQLVPVGAPTPRWASTAVYDEHQDRLVIATGSSDVNGSVTNDVWALPLANPSAWTQLNPGGALPSPRYLSSAIYDPATGELLLFGGFGSGAQNDVWGLDLANPLSWTEYVSTGPTPSPRWSHMSTYRELPAQLVTFGGWNGSNYLTDVWALTRPTPVGPPVIQSFAPLGGQVGDQVTIIGIHLDAPTGVSFNGTPASVVSSSLTKLVVTVPDGATTGPIQVTNAQGSGVSSTNFFVGLPPEIASFLPDSGRVGDVIEIRGQNLTSTTKVEFGSTGSALFTVLSDSVVDATVDTLASSGPIRLTTRVASTVSSSPFVRTASDPRPHLLSVRDVPADQGGKVMLRWRASDFDQAPYRIITGYRVWRRAPAPAQALRGQPLPAGWMSSPTPGGTAADPTEFWESIAELPAAFLKGYAFAAPTLSDSSEAGNPFMAYFVQALTGDPFVFYNSSPDSGYSVDNLAPPSPSPMTVLYGPAENVMHWRASNAPDLRGYELYRGTSSSFLPSPATLVATTAETSFTDGPGAHYYKLAAVDVHGNHSRFVAVAPDVPVGTLAAFVHSDRAPGHVQLTWYSGGNSGMQAHVQRRTDLADWSTLGTVTVDGTGFLRFDDASVEDGVGYAYRLAILDDQGVEDTFTSESWIDPLGAMRLSLALGANPTVGGRIALALTLPGAAQATVTLFDLAGREVERQAIHSGGDGRVDVTLGGSERLRPGLYMIRVTSGGATATRRVVVIL